MNKPDALSPQAMQSWVDSLPYANLPMVAKEVLAMTEQIANSTLQAAERVRLVAIVQRPVDILLDRIQSRLVASDSQSEKFLVLGETLCSRMVALAECGKVDPARGLGKFLQKKPNAQLQSVQLRLHFFERWRLLGMIDHHAAPAGFWPALSQQCRLSETESAVWSRLVALELACTQSMSSSRIRDLIEVLQGLPMERLVRGGNPVKEPGLVGFFIDAGADGPAYGELPVGATPIDLSGLVRYFEQASPTEAVADLAEVSQRWQGVPTERPDRTVTEGYLPVQAVAGFRNILRFLELNGLAADFNEIEVGQASFNAGTGLADGMPVAANALVVDSSANGCRVNLNVASVEIEDLVAFEWPGQDWRVGRVVWKKRVGKAWDCGIQWALSQARGAVVRLKSGQAVSGLVGNLATQRGLGLIYDAPAAIAEGSLRVKTGSVWERLNCYQSCRIGPLQCVRIEQPQPEVGSLSETDAKSASAKPAAGDDWDWLDF